MSKHDEIAAIVEKYCGALADYDLTYNNKRYWGFYSYKTFPSNKKSNLLKFDKNLFEADMAAMYSIDSGVINPDAEKCKNGILFMLSGFYIRTSGQLKGYTFIKYSAIKSIEVKGKKDLHLSLNVNTNDFWKQDWLDISVDYYAEPLKNILEEIIKIDRETDTSYTTESKTGIVKGINQKANREAYFKGQVSGYKRASREYQIKLQKQADAFLANCNLWRKKQSEYEALLDEYEQTIIELKSCMEQSSSPEYQEMMDSAQDYKERLKKNGMLMEKKMTDLEELRSKRASLKKDTDQIIISGDSLFEESQRVADLAGNTETVITDLETEFEKRTKLHGQDIAFLFFATALQCARQYLLTDFKERLGDQESAKNTLGENKFDPHNASSDRSHHLYNPSLEEIISHPVPFDLNIGGEKFGNPLSGYGKLGHRAATLGHDSVLGWIFGTANIATSTVTDAKFNSYHVGSNNLRDYFKSNANTALVLEKTFDKLTNQGMDGKIIVGTSLAKEAVHLLSDVNSKNSLPLPIVTTFNPKLGSTLAKYGIDMSNVLNVGKQAALAEAINIIIAMIHRLTFGLDSEVDTKLYEVRTRKIITYSNVIASTSNIILVAMGSAVGAATDNPEMIRKSLKKLDVGGFLVTVGHLLNDKKFITQVKTEFVLNNFDRLIQGDY